METTTVAFIQECLTAERERRSFSSTNNTYSAQPSILHTLQERQWSSISNDRHEDRPLTLRWDHSGRYCAEGTTGGSIIVWNFEQNSIPYNAFDRQGYASFLPSDGLLGGSPKSACITWSESCHEIYMASNIEVDDAATNMNESSCERRAVLMCWSLMGDELPICSKR